jgi:hypothetical protein
MKQDKFYPTCYEEQETHIWIDYYSGTVIVDTNRKHTYDVLTKKLGESEKKQYVKEGNSRYLAGARWDISFEDKRARQILSKTNIIGGARSKIKDNV